jgi:hypothetical protein
VKHEIILNLLMGAGMAVAYVVVIGLILYQVAKSRRNREAVKRGEGLDDTARALGGEVTQDPAFDGPVVRFATDGIPTYFRQWMLFESNDSRPDVATTFECRTGFGGFLEATSLQAVRYPTRSPRFRVLPQEACFQIVTTDPAWATDLLNRGLRQILRDFADWQCKSRITLAPDRFLLEVESRITPEVATKAARLVFRLAALSHRSDPSAGVTFLDGVQVSATGRCPVCGQAFELARVHCAQCKVPHHADCWTYWGRCAIFGCRGVRPTSASRG